MNKRITWSQSIAIIAIILLLAIFQSLKINNIQKNVLYLSQNDINLVIADSAEERIKGLSGKESIRDDEAMLFVFDEPSIYSIWMKDMNFSIDIIWLNSLYRIVHIEKNISPETFPKIFSPDEKSLYIIEAKAGFSEKNNLKEGMILNFSK